jgi:hypothetical protein
MSCYGDTLALLDGTGNINWDKHQLWIYDPYLLKEPINFSYILKKKFVDISVGYRELRLNSGKNIYVLFWHDRSDDYYKC